jgi:hypothetical protein
MHLTALIGLTMLASCTAASHRSSATSTASPNRAHIVSALPRVVSNGAIDPRVNQALDLRDSGRPLEAERLLLGWICPDLDRSLPLENLPYEKLSSCPAPDSGEAATAWTIVGLIEFEGLEPLDAMRDLSLQRSEFAFGRGLERSPSRMSIGMVRYMRAWTGYRRGRFEASMLDFLAVLAAPAPQLAAMTPADLANEAVEYAAMCITESDWDGDDKPDTVQGFDRPEVQRAMAHETPQTANVYARAVKQWIDMTDRQAANAGLAALRARFPNHPQIADLSSEIAMLR